MNENVLNKEVQEFISDNLQTDVHTILLGKRLFPNMDNKELVEQLESKKKAEKKLPTWFSSKNIYYANKLNISQTSSEVAAKYKSELVSGETMIDLTGGFGVDAFYFSKRFKHVIHIERNEELSEIAQYNFNQLGANNIDCIIGDGIKYLQSSKENSDWIYVDPSRRDKDNRRVYFLKDCEPDVTVWLELIFSRTNNILLKTGPLLDLTLGIQQLQKVHTIHIISVENDVKEILWELKKNHEEEPLIKTINFNKDEKELFQFYVQEERDINVAFSEPLLYLYEPNSSIMKSGGFHLIGKRYGVKKLQEHSHLYTSETLVSFPGRIFKVNKVIPYSKKSIKQLGIQKANITTRNFPETVAEIRRKTKLRDGGQNFLFFTKNLNQDLIIIYTVPTTKI
ncbi:THUMP-like domain-containing protein [Maribacter cobaltidurans]|uniref:SAM-dependent methyltransferase n=1 Tax=Maribacter cobaltidurans TaxID=1178778 RepID=A0A223V0K9_9FLAO|nr:class I SAM-dependent methyltransferase [Maribacter cobaltidurans]ASV28871.1 SAM-dependent methyltransferase [Maribacter cobaltidurans]GGD74116.1 hypothetical protein GCM10011412_09700 [Maribacter cobaltidurans]